MSHAATDAQLGRPLRSDAAANRERILAAATIAVRRDGERVPMATIAEEAGVGIGTVYRHYPTRPALLAALTLRSFHLVMNHARAAALSDEPAPVALTQFLEQTIAARDQFVLPLHGGPVIQDQKINALQREIRNLLEQVLARGRRDRTIRPDATPHDIILTGAMLAQPLPHTADWDQLASDRPGSSSQASPLAIHHPPRHSYPESETAGRALTAFTSITAWRSAVDGRGHAGAHSWRSSASPISQIVGGHSPTNSARRSALPRSS